MQEGTGWLDYGARMYSSDLGRWLTIDPAIEEAHHNYTPYSYNNPLRFKDPIGRDSLDAVALKQAAENAVAKIIKDYGKTTAQCNRGVNAAFNELTGSKILEGKTANEQIKILEKSGDVTKIALEDVQSAANNGEIVIAGKSEKDNGHVVLGVPGEEGNSGNWKGKVPQVMDTGDSKRTAKQTINYSWTKKLGVKYYKYTGGTLRNGTYRGGTLKGVTVSGKQIIHKPIITGVKI